MTKDKTSIEEIKIRLAKEFSLPELIRDYRMYHKLSQTQFGELLGVSHAAVSDMERGRTRHISPELFVLLVDYIKVTPNSQIQRSNVKIADWATGSDTGASSKALMRYMLGLKPSSWGFFAPSDADDRGRCVRLLNLFPEWLERLDEMAQFICWGEQIPLIKSEFEQYKLERTKDNE